MKTILQGSNVELTDDLRAFVDRKLQDAYRQFGDMNLEAVQMHVELEATSRRHPQERDTEQRYRAEANVSLPGRFLRVEGTASTLRQAIVRMKNKLSREIRTWRERMADQARSGARTFKTEIKAEVKP